MENFDFGIVGYYSGRIVYNNKTKNHIKYSFAGNAKLWFYFGFGSMGIALP